MKKIILYIAASLDGYIATDDHSVAWLDRIENPEGSDYGYHDFIHSVDTLLMGRKTYDIIRGFDMEWPYPGQKSYVLTTREGLSADTPDTEVLTCPSEDSRNDNPGTGQIPEAGLNPGLKTKIQQLKKGDNGKHIWLLGGGQTIAALLELQLIDELMLFTAPVLLGSGIPLFPGSDHTFKLQLLDSKTYTSGMLLSHYKFNYS